MMENPVSLMIGGKLMSCPPMSFYALERAWPHIQTLSRMGALSKAVEVATSLLRDASPGEATQRAQAALDYANLMVQEQGADLIGQTSTALRIIVAAFSLSEPAPTYDDLARRLLPGEISGVHLACSALMDSSGLMVSNPGEASATNRTPPPLSNGADSSPSLSHTA